MRGDSTPIDRRIAGRNNSGRKSLILCFFQPTDKDPHFLQRLLVAFAFGRSDPGIVRLQGIIRLSGRDQCFAQQIPRRRVIRIELDRAAQMHNRLLMLARAHTSVAETETQQRVIAPGSENFFKSDELC